MAKPTKTSEDLNLGRFRCGKTIEVTVTFSEPFAVYPVRVGYVDPVRERSGVVGRLRQLGYLPGPVASNEELGEDVRVAEAEA